MRGAHAGLGLPRFERRPQPAIGETASQGREKARRVGERTDSVRNPLGVVGLSLITLGIYFFFWWYFINREMHDLGRARRVNLGENPTNSVLAITLGALIVVPAIVTMTTSGRVEEAQEAFGIDRRVSGPLLFVLLLLIGPVGLWYAQSELNKAWQAERASAAAASPPPEAEPSAPPTPA